MARSDRRRPSPTGSRTARDTVERIYRARDGRMPDFTRLDRRTRSSARWIVGGGLVTLAVLAIAAWASFLIFKPYASPTSSGVTVAIDAPPVAALGEDITYRIRIANEDRVPIASASLELHLPEGFSLADADPLPGDARGTWTLGSIEGNDVTTVTLHGQLYGAPAQPATVAATVVYRPGNFNADFQAHADATTMLGASPLTLTVDGPERAAPGERVTYTVAYTYTGTRTSPSVRLFLEAPRTFVLERTTPERSSTSELAWDLGELAKGATGEITLVGSYSSGAREPSTIRATATIAPRDARVTLDAQAKSTTVLGGDAALLATANDQTSVLLVRPGDRIRFRFALRNDGETAMESVAFRAVLEATSVGEQGVLNFNAITDPADGTITGEQLAPGLRRGTIVWGQDVGVTIAPGEQRTMDFSLPVHTPQSLPGFPATARITYTASATVGATGGTAAPYTISATPVIITVTQ